MDQRTYNSLYRRGLRPKPENPYAFCESIADVTQLHKIELKKLQTYKKKISDSLNSDMFMAEKFFFKEQLPLLAGNLDMSTVIDIMCKDMDSYTWSPDIFNTLDSIGVDTANIRRRFQNEFGNAVLSAHGKKAKKNKAVLSPASPARASDDIVLVGHQTLDERLASDLADAEKNGTLIVLE